MENIFFLVLVAVIGLVRWLLQTAENQKNSEAHKRSSGPASERSSRAPAQSEEERVRKFFEALGMPASTSAAPTPKAERRQIITPKTPRPKPTILPVDPFPVPRTIPATLLPQASPPTVAKPGTLPSNTAPIPPAPVVIPDRGPFARVEGAATRFEVQEIGAGAEVDDFVQRVLSPSNLGNAGENAVRVQQGIAGRFATPEGLRDAILLREIFGPPRSLRPFNRSVND